MIDTDNNLKVFCDGGARGNPGPAASAFVVYKQGKQIHKGSKYLGESTNNVSEYTAVVLALEWLSKNTSEDTETISFVLDSELVTKQLNGLYKIKNERLRDLAIKAKSLEKKIASRITYTWSPRSKNKIADSLVNEELDENT
jgi:ribonuclease HI